jgi:hypothetical protein
MPVKQAQVSNTEGNNIVYVIYIYKSETGWVCLFVCLRSCVHVARRRCKVLRTIGNFPRRTPVPELHKAFSIPYIYDYITELSRQQAEVIQNHGNVNVRNNGQGEARHRKYKRFKLGGGQAYDRSNE